MKEPRGYEVMARRCRECLYGPDKIVPNSRRAEILRKLHREDRHFICHKASIAGREVRCHGDYEQRPHARCDRLAAALGLKPVFVEESDL